LYSTHKTREAAERWAALHEKRLDLAGESGALEYYTLADIIAAYRADPPELGGIPNYKATCLRTIEEVLGDVRLDRLNRAEFIRFAQVRAREHGVAPPTIQMDVGVMADLLRYADDFLQIPTADLGAELADARRALASRRLISPSRKRSRRVMQEEVETLCAYWEGLPKRRGAVTAIIPDVVRFAVASAMRLGEICSIRWADVDEQKRTVVIRQRKHPRQKVANDQTVPLLGDAWTILQRQPTKGKVERIFPIGVNTISSAFSRAALRCGLDDVTFHDLRHEGISRLFEQGYGIAEVAVVSGHSDWNHLKRDTQIRPETLHDGPAGRRAK